MPNQVDLPLSASGLDLLLSGPGLGLSFFASGTNGHSFQFAAQDLYQIELTTPKGEKLWIGSSQSVGLETHVEDVEGSKQATLVFKHAWGLQYLIVNCQVLVPHQSRPVEWRIHVANGTGYAVQRIKYPLVELVKREPDTSAAPFRYPYDWNASHHSAMLLGIFDGMVVPNPYDEIPDGFSWTEEHPGRMGTQLLAYYDTGGGLCLFTQDGTGFPKLIGFQRRGDILDLSPTHLFPRIFGADVRLDYAVSLSSFHGDWQAAADVYKAWALTQAWTQVPITQRQDLPAWLRSAYPFLLYVQQRPGRADHGVNWQASTPRHMLAELRSYQSRLGSPLVALIFGWEKHCSWITPDVFPAFPSQEEFSELVNGLKEFDSRTFLYTSGTRWAVKNPRDPDWDGQEHWELDGQAASCVSENGDWSYDSRPWAVNHKLCIAAEGTRKMMDHYTQGFAELGIDATQYDQNLGGETYVCFSDQHGHPPGYGRWMYDSTKGMLDYFLAKNREHNSQFAISVEEPNEILIPHLTFYDSRAEVYHGWPLLTNMPCLGVPLFSYLYHEYALGFGGDYHIFLTGPQAGVVKVGRIVSAGHLLCEFIRPGDMSSGADPAFSLFKQAAEAIRTYAYPFLVTGKMLPTPHYEVAECFSLTKSIAQSYYDDQRIEYVHPEYSQVRVPVVLASAWSDPQGRPGCVLVNMSTESQLVTLDWDSLGSAGQVEWVMVNLDGLVHYQRSGDNSALMIQIPPLQVSVIHPVV